jgi:hypothetical protein
MFFCLGFCMEGFVSSLCWQRPHNWPCRGAEALAWREALRAAVLAVRKGHAAGDSATFWFFDWIVVKNGTDLRQAV